MRFAQKIQALDRFDPFLSTLNVLPGFTAQIVKMNTDRLYKLGEYTTGDAIADRVPYKPLTIQIKRSKGQPTDRVTLKDTGDFHASIFLRFDTQKMEVVADDPKTAKLVRKYGTEILGLTEANMIELKEMIMPQLLERFKKAAYA